MGFFARLFGTDPESRLAKARKFLEAGAWNDARMEVEGLDGFEAEGIRQRALRGLVELNLEEARLCLIAGDFERSKEHMDLAQQFGATADELREVRTICHCGKKVHRLGGLLPTCSHAIWCLAAPSPKCRCARLLAGNDGRATRRRRHGRQGRCTSSNRRE